MHGLAYQPAAILIGETGFGKQKVDVPGFEAGDYFHGALQRLAHVASIQLAGFTAIHQQNALGLDTLDTVQQQGAGLSFGQVTTVQYFAECLVTGRVQLFAPGRQVRFVGNRNHQAVGAEIGGCGGTERILHRKM